MVGFTKKLYTAVVKTADFEKELNFSFFFFWEGQKKNCLKDRAEGIETTEGLMFFKSQILNWEALPAPSSEFQEVAGITLEELSNGKKVNFSAMRGHPKDDYFHLYTDDKIQICAGKVYIKLVVLPIWGNFKNSTFTFEHNVPSPEVFYAEIKKIAQC